MNAVPVQCQIGTVCDLFAPKTDLCCLCWFFNYALFMHAWPSSVSIRQFWTKETHLPGSALRTMPINFSHTSSTILCLDCVDTVGSTELEYDGSEMKN